jgi:hypothetical protein
MAMMRSAMLAAMPAGTVRGAVMEYDSNTALPDITFLCKKNPLSAFGREFFHVILHRNL